MIGIDCQFIFMISFIIGIDSSSSSAVVDSFRSAIEFFIDSVLEYVFECIDLARVFHLYWLLSCMHIWNYLACAFDFANFQLGLFLIFNQFHYKFKYLLLFALEVWLHLKMVYWRWISMIVRLNTLWCHKLKWSKRVLSGGVAAVVVFVCSAFFLFLSVFVVFFCAMLWYRFHSVAIDIYWMWVKKWSGTTVFRK